MATLRIEPDVHIKIKLLQPMDLDVQKILQEDTEKKKADFHISDEGILRFPGSLVVPNDVELREDILSKAHRSSYGIHPSSTKMYQNLRQCY